MKFACIRNSEYFINEDLQSKLSLIYLKQALSVKKGGVITYKQKIGISIGNEYCVPMDETLQIIKNVGFDAISPVWKSREALFEIAHTAKKLGLEIQSLHAPFKKAADMWSSQADICGPVKDELLEAIDFCAQLQIPILVVHVWLGFDYKFEKELLYYENFDETVNYAERNGIKIDG